MIDLTEILSDSANLYAALATKAAQNGDLGEAEAHARRSRMAYLFQRSVESNRAAPQRKTTANVITLKF